MKKLKRTLLTGLAVLLLAGCSEDSKQYGLVDQTIHELPSDNNPVAHRAAAKDASVLRATFANGAGEGWDKNDKVSVYSLKSVFYNTYELTSGAGTANAVFTRNAGEENFEEGGTIYALTSTDYIYSFSATVNGGAKVSVTIPQQYNITEVGAPEGGSRMPVPYWGIVTFGEDGKLETTFRGMTALLKIDTTTLPEGTYAVVLTTNKNSYLGADALEPGDGEPLSGTFDTELKEGATVAANRIFRSYDTLRINLDSYGGVEGRHRYLFVPVIAGSYAKLHVLAVTGEDYDNHWEGKLLKTFSANNPFYSNTIVVIEPQSTAIHTPRI